MMRYQLAAPTTVTVRATSAVHDTTMVCKQVTGTVALGTAATEAQASASVAMLAFDAGDWLKNRTLRKDYQLEKYSEATFVVTKLEDITLSNQVRRGMAIGMLRWRQREVPVTITGEVTADDRTLRGKGTFQLDIRTFGVEAPKLLMIQVNNVVTVDIELHGVRDVA